MDAQTTALLAEAQRLRQEAMTLLDDGTAFRVAPFSQRAAVNSEAAAKAALSTGMYVEALIRTRSET